MGLCFADMKVQHLTALLDTSAAGLTVLAYPEGDTKPYAHNTIINIIKSQNQKSRNEMRSIAIYQIFIKYTV